MVQRAPKNGFIWLALGFLILKFLLLALDLFNPVNKDLDLCLAEKDLENSFSKLEPNKHWFEKLFNGWDRSFDISF